MAFEFKTKIEPIEKNRSITCKHCGFGFSDVYSMTGPKGAVVFARCNSCGEETMHQFTENQDFSEPSNFYGVKCPFCQSKNCKKISAASKVGKVALFGVFAAGSVSKTWHCNSCGSNFG